MEQTAATIAYLLLEMTGYVLKISSYRTARYEQLYDYKRIVGEVHFLFFIKKGSNVDSRNVKEY